MAGAAITGLLMFVRTLTGMFEGIAINAWSWYFLHTLPSLVLLIVAVAWNRNPSKVIRTSVFYTIYACAVCYLLLFLATMFGRPDTSAGQSLEDYLALSNVWLLPFQIVLIFLFGLFYFRKEIAYTPNAAIMTEYIGKKASYMQRNGSLLQVQSLDLLIEPDGLGKALTLLAGQSRDNHLILLQGQYANWSKSRDLDTVDPGILQRELNRMTLSVIDFIENLNK